MDAPADRSLPQAVSFLTRRSVRVVGALVLAMVVGAGVLLLMEPPASAAMSHPYAQASSPQRELARRLLATHAPIALDQWQQAYIVPVAVTAQCVQEGKPSAAVLPFSHFIVRPTGEVAVTDAWRGQVQAQPGDPRVYVVLEGDLATGTLPSAAQSRSVVWLSRQLYDLLGNQRDWRLDLPLAQLSQPAEAWLTTVRNQVYEAPRS